MVVTLLGVKLLDKEKTIVRKGRQTKHRVFGWAK